MTQLSMTVLIATVFPPVLGPVMMIPLACLPMLNCRGMLSALSISGCLASFKTMYRPVLIAGSTASISMLNFPLEKMKSSFSIRRMFSRISGTDSATIAVSVYRMRYTSFSSLMRSCCNSSSYFATLAGSIKKVLPVADLSITLPGILNLYSFFTGTQILPLRVVQ